LIPKHTSRVKRRAAAEYGENCFGPFDLAFVRLCVRHSRFRNRSRPGFRSYSGLPIWLRSLFWRVQDRRGRGALALG